MDTNSEAFMNKKTRSKAEATRGNSSRRKSRPGATGKAYETKDKSHAKIFLHYTGKEKRHDLILENIIDFVNRPKSWLENAEWYHLEEY